MATKVSVVVVNWNGERYLPACLSSLVAQRHVQTEIILIDNGSSDGSVALVSREFPSVRLLQNTRNEGFAAATNRGILASSGEYVATFNNDAWAEPEWLFHLFEAAESAQDIGACTSKMVFADSPGIINSTGIMLDKVGIAWDRLGGHREADTPGENCEVFGACAGAALYRRSLFDDVGLFDEDFFAFLEDVDLAWRARLAGWRCLYVPAAKVHHVHSGTAQEGSAFKNYLLGRNKVWTIVKNYPAPDLFWYLPLIALYDLASLQYGLLVRGDWSPLRGRVAALRGLRSMLAKRRVIQDKRTVGLRELGACLEPLSRPDELLRRYRHLTRVKHPGLK